MEHDSRPSSADVPLTNIGAPMSSQSSLLATSASPPPAETLSTGEDQLRPRQRRFGRWFLLALVVASIGAIMWFVPPVWKLIDGPVKVTRWTKKQGRIEATVGPKEKDWIPFVKVSRHTVHAIVSSEDGKFYQHRGLDWESIRAAYELNKRRGQYARGGSTITQQVVKMAFLSREKTMIRKAREAVGALLLESILSKDRILEWYLNLAEFGDGVYGIQRGSWHYFHTKPELLTIAQSIHLALVLPSPNRWSKGLRTRRLSSFGHKRFAAILNNMKLSGYVSHTQWLATVRSGDFGRPLAGYTALVAAEREGKLCQGDTDCLESVAAPTGEEAQPADRDAGSSSSFDTGIETNTWTESFSLPPAAGLPDLSTSQPSPAAAEASPPGAGTAPAAGTTAPALPPPAESGGMAEPAAPDVAPAKAASDGAASSFDKPGKEAAADEPVDF